MEMETQTKLKKITSKLILFLGQFSATFVNFKNRPIWSHCFDRSPTTMVIENAYFLSNFVSF